VAKRKATNNGTDKGRKTSTNYSTETMNPDSHKATPEQWAFLRDRADAQNCILELLARVEALEGARRPAPKIYEISKPLKLTPEQEAEIAALLRPNSKPTVNGPLLVTRVAAVISEDDEIINWPGAYAAIREVAAWLREQHDGDLVAATALEREAGR